MKALSPVQQRRLRNFRRNRRGYWSLWIFLVLFGLSLCAELIANDNPLPLQKCHCGALGYQGCNCNGYVAKAQTKGAYPLSTL